MDWALPGAQVSRRAVQAIETCRDGPITGGIAGPGKIRSFGRARKKYQIYSMSCVIFAWRAGGWHAAC
jgi:hypothetical protein